MGRFVSVGVTSSAALRSTGAAACGLAAATLVNGANSAPIAAAYSWRVCLTAGPPGVVDQRVLAGRAGEPVRHPVPGHHAGQADPAVFQAALGVFGEVGPWLATGKVLDGGDGLRPDEQRHLAVRRRRSRRRTR